MLGRYFVVGTFNYMGQGGWKKHAFVIVIKAFEFGVVERKPKLQLAYEQSKRYRQSKNKPNRKEMH